MGSSRFVGVLALIVCACGPSTTAEELCARFGLVPDRARDACRCPDGTTRREDGTGCDLADGGFLPFPDAGAPDAGSDAAPAFDAGSDAGDASNDDAGDCERCDGPTCVDVSSDPSNCGACGRRCAEGWECDAGECVDVPVALTAGAFTTCARMGSGDVYCWGSNVAGVAGVDSTEEMIPEPTKVVGIDRAVDVDTSGYHSCAVESTGLVYCWGDNQNGEVSASAPAEVRAPRRVLGLENVRQAETGLDHTCIAYRSGSVACWGANGFGQLGAGDLDPHDDIRDVDIEGAQTIEAGGSTTCAVVSGGALQCWGALRPDGMSGVTSLPVTATGLSSIETVAGSVFSFCASGSTGGVYCWGILGALIPTMGRPLLSSTTEPTLIGDTRSTRASSLATGGQLYRSVEGMTLYHHACFSDVGGVVSCWGTNNVGQLGRGSLDSQPFPVSLEFEPVGEVAVGDAHTCARLERGRVACWGRGTALGVGDDGAPDQRAPVVLDFFPIREAP
jgi:alpha-tubulin suppressor-like RCC1 family protein